MPVEKTSLDRKDVKSNVQNTSQTDVSQQELLQSALEDPVAAHSAVSRSGPTGSSSRLRGVCPGDSHEHSSVEIRGNSGRRTVRNSNENIRKRHDVGSRGNRAVVEGSQSSTRRVERNMKMGTSSSQPSRLSSHPARLSRMIVTNDRRLISQSSAVRYDGKCDVETLGGTVSITVVTESQDARRNFPDHPLSVTSVAGPDRRSEKKSTIIVHCE